MEYTNPSQINPQDPNFASQPAGNVPPPPPQQQQVGIRSMESDLSSIQESGGEAPQSQIVSAPELSALRETPSSQPSFTPPSTSSPTPEIISADSTGRTQHFSISFIISTGSYFSLF